MLYNYTDIESIIEIENWQNSTIEIEIRRKSSIEIEIGPPLRGPLSDEKK